MLTKKKRRTSLQERYSMTLGQKIRSVRGANRLTLKQVADGCGLSMGYISQLENDRANPTLGTLKVLMQVFDLPLAYLFNGRDSGNTVAVTRRTERKTFTLPKSDVTFELLTPDTNRKLEVLLATADPGVKSGPRRFVHEGEECGLVLSGTLKLRVGDEEYVLEEGDSVYFPSNIPHDWENAGDQPVVGIWIRTPPSF
jgi:transcriptional regulator with XRE-family HTH domain